MWVPLAFLLALFDSLQNTYYKKSSVQFSPVLMAWSVLVISGISYIPLLFFNIPHQLDTIFWLAVFLRLIIDSAAFTLFIKGVQQSPLSLTAPMSTLIPVLSVFTVFFINHLLPSKVGMVGILLTVGGLYLLHFDHDTKHLLSPFKSIAKERGVLFVAIAAVLWSVVSALQKLAIDHSTVSFYTSFFQIFWAICFTPVAFFSDKKGFAALFSPKKVFSLLPAGILDALKNLAQNIGYALTIPAYVNSVGNTGVLISTFFAAYFFKEKVKNHVVPIGIIFLGVTLIVLG